MKTRWIEIIIIVIALGLLSLCFAAWDVTKPADSDAIYTWPASIRANWAALDSIASQGIINVMDDTYGAVGDGDGAGGGTDDATAFQNAITAAANGVLVIPEGTYRIDSALTSTSKITIRGLGKVTLDFSNIAGATIALKIYGTAGTRLEEKTVLEDFIIFGPETNAVNGATTTTTKGLHFEYLLGLRLVNVEVRGFYTGVYITDSWPISDTDCKFWANYIGLHLDNDCTFGTHSSRYLANYTALYLLEGVTNQTFINCDFEAVGNNAIVIDPSGDSIWGLQFINPYFESIGGSAFVIRKTIAEVASTGNVWGVLISGGIWSSITDYALNTDSSGIHSFTMLNCYGIDDISADIANPLRRSLLIGGNTSLTDGMYYWDNARLSSLLLTVDNSKDHVISLLSTTTIALNADADTTLYTVPTGERCILSHAILVAGADASTSDISIGANGSETDFIPAYDLQNLDAQYDCVLLAPIPAVIALQLKTYIAATVIEAQVTNQAGGATNTLYLYGTLY